MYGFVKNALSTLSTYIVCIPKQLQRGTCRLAQLWRSWKKQNKRIRYPVVYELNTYQPTTNTRGNIGYFLSKPDIAVREYMGSFSNIRLISPNRRSSILPVGWSSIRYVSLCTLSPETDCIEIVYHIMYICWEYKALKLELEPDPPLTRNSSRISSTLESFSGPTMRPDGTSKAQIRRTLRCLVERMYDFDQNFQLYCEVFFRGD